MLSLQRLLEERSSAPGPAIVEGSTGAGVTWAEVRDLAGRWAESGVSGPVGLALRDPVAMAANFVAAVAAGVAVAPLDPKAPRADLDARVLQLGLRGLVLSASAGGAADTTSTGPENPIQTWYAGRRHLTPAGGTPPPTLALPPVPAQVATIMASSGTTGVPKIVPLTAEQLLDTAAGVAEQLGLTEADRGYSPLPLFHINGLVVGVLSALVSGASIAVEPQFSRRSFWSAVERCGATWVNLVPAILAILGNPPEGEIGGRGFSERVRLARSASAPLPLPVKDRFEALTGIPVVETYGMTEAASQITANPPAAVRAGSVGLPVGVDLRVVSPRSGRSLPPGERGMVQIRGRRVTSVYWALEGAPGRQVWSWREATDGDGWMSTGDIGCVDDDGYVYLVGREGDVINRGGEKIQPREVEEVILADPRVTSAVVVGRPHPTVGEEPVAFVLPRSDAVPPDQLAAELNERCAEELSRFKRPAEIRVATTLPAGPTGKVRRAEVRAMALSEITESIPEPDDRPGGEAPGAPPPSPRPERLPMDSIFLDVPARQSKPRTHGLTMVIDNGMAQGEFADAVASCAPYIDLVKFGWGTALVTPDIERKLDILRQHRIGFYFGGTLFEKFVKQDRFDSFLTLCRLCGCEYVEVSAGTIELSDEEKAGYIRRCAEEFTVLSEVGYKDQARSSGFTSNELVASVHSDFEAGATLVITEARESGKSGICRPDGTPREDLLDALLASGVDETRLLFEAPTKDLQTHFIKLAGPDANLGNIAPSDVIGLETLRLGLRSDTLLFFERERSRA